MKDIDFDELDKAVNSLMATVPSESPASSADSATPVNVVNPSVVDGQIPGVPSAPLQQSATPSVLATDAQALPVSPQYIPASVTEDVPSRPTAPAVRRGGRFMDMVHTSSDMKASVPVSPASSRREGVAITPRPQVVEPMAPIDDAQNPIGPTAATVPEIMPDPIDVSVQKDEESADARQVIAGSVPDVIDAAAASLSPMDSPFLADAKVEKRPLNANSPNDAPFDLMADIESEGDNSADDVSVPRDNSQDEPPAVPQVPELSSDLVAIESDEPIGIDVQNSAPVDNPPVAEKAAVSVGATSIAQQYTAQESSGDKTHAAIYDASQYPDPVTHPAKQKSGWLWVLWVLLLLGLGAGGAFLLYYLGIIP